MARSSLFFSFSFFLQRKGRFSLSQDWDNSIAFVSGRRINPGWRFVLSSFGILDSRVGV
jgi:hypothetical protein